MHRRKNHGADLKMFNQRLKKMLDKFEKAMADRNCRDSTKCYTKCDIQKHVDEERTIKTPEHRETEKVLARHEDINVLLKEFGCVKRSAAMIAANTTFSLVLLLQSHKSRCMMDDLRTRLMDACC